MYIKTEAWQANQPLWGILLLSFFCLEITHLVMVLICKRCCDYNYLFNVQRRLVVGRFLFKFSFARRTKSACHGWVMKKVFYHNTSSYELLVCLATQLNNVHIFIKTNAFFKLVSTPIEKCVLFIVDFCNILQFYYIRGPPSCFWIFNFKTN